MFPAACLVLSLLTTVSSGADPVEMNEALKDIIEEAGKGDLVVADAVFRGDYVGIVRMFQRLGDENDGALETRVMVNLKHKGNLTKKTDFHMWHVEHDPIMGVDCAPTNRHYAPLGIMKDENYTTYCSPATPDYCELGDISTKSSLTSLGQGPQFYSVPLLPIAGPLTVIGHSVNIHEENMIKVRRACANIVLNKRMTRARLVDVHVNIQDSIDAEAMLMTRIKMASALGIDVAKIQTAQRLDTMSGCTKITFLIFGQRTYSERVLRDLRDGKQDIGPLTPINCWVEGEFIRNLETPEDKPRQGFNDCRDWKPRNYERVENIVMPRAQPSREYIPRGGWNGDRSKIYGMAEGFGFPYGGKFYPSRDQDGGCGNRGSRSDGEARYDDAILQYQYAGARQQRAQGYGRYGG